MWLFHHWPTWHLLLMWENEREMAVGWLTLGPGCNLSSFICHYLPRLSLMVTQHLLLMWIEGEGCWVAHLEQCVLLPSTQCGMLTDAPGHLHHMLSKMVCVWGLWCGVATLSLSLGCTAVVGGGWTIVARGGGSWWWWCSGGGHHDGGCWEGKSLLFVDNVFVMWQMPTNIMGLTHQ